jgi:beta-carotene 3-hydroxylase
MLNLLIILSTYISMEAATWTIHKYVMHGFLWFLHRDHHDHSTKGAFEKNDWFFVIFATPAILLIYLGVSTVYSQLLYIGIGITMYGFSYFFVHDIFIHQRLKVLQQTKNPYLKAIRRAHKQHHKHISKENGECFGFLWVPIKYFKLYLK